MASSPDFTPFILNKIYETDLSESSCSCLENEKEKVIIFFQTHEKNLVFPPNFFDITFGNENKTNEAKFHRILLFLFFFQKNELKFCEYFASLYLEDNHNNSGKKQENFFQDDQEALMETLMDLLDKNEFFFNEIMEYVIYQCFSFNFMDVILPFYKYSVYNFPRKLMQEILETSKFSFTEKLGWINILIKHSKTDNSNKLKLIEPKKKFEFKRYIKKKIIKLQIHELLKQNKIAADFREINQEIIKECINHEYVSLLEYFGLEIRLSPSLLNLLLEKQIFEIFIRIFKKYKLKSYLQSEQAWEQIFILTQTTKGFAHGLLLIFNLTKLETFKIDKHNTLIRFFQNLIKTQQILEILTCPNPIAVLIELCFLSLKLSKLNTPFFKLYQIYADFFKSTAIEIFSKTVHNLNECENLIFKICYPSKFKLIDTLLKQKEYFSDFLALDLILKAMKNSIYCKYQHDYNILSASSTFMILKSSHLDYFEENTFNSGKNVMAFFKNSQTYKTNANLNTLEIFPLLNIFKLIKKTSLSFVLKNNHIYQLKIYLNSIMFRSYLDFLAHLSCFVFIFKYFNEYNILSAEIPNQETVSSMFFNSYILPNKYINESAKTYRIEEIIQKYNPGNNLLMARCIQFFYFNFLTIPNFDQISFLNDYLKECSDFFNVLDGLLNIWEYYRAAILVAFFLGSKSLASILYQWKMLNKVYISQEIIRDFIVLILSMTIYYFQDNVWSFSFEERQVIVEVARIIGTIILLMFWINFIDYCELIEFFSLKIKITKQMIRDLLSFIVIILFSLIGFSLLSYSYFSTTIFQEQSYEDSIFLFLGASFGNFELNINDTDHLLFSIVLICFIFFMTILLFNLLIAILSNTYSQMIEKGNLEYARLLYKTKKLKKYDKKYGALVSFPFPINLIALCFSPVYFFHANTCFDWILTNICYALLLLSFIVIFTISNIVLLPLAYLKVLLVIILCKYRVEKVKKTPKILVMLLHFLIWLVLGIPYLLYLSLCHDLPLFIVSAYKICKNKINSLTLDGNFFNLFEKYLADLENKRIISLELEDFSQKFFEFKKNTEIDKRVLLMKQRIFLKKEIDDNEISLYFKRLLTNERIDITSLVMLKENLNFSLLLQNQNNHKNLANLWNIINLKSIFKVLLEKKNEMCENDL